MNRNDIEIICVNYNTPDLIDVLLNSWRDFLYNDIHIHIVDGSDTLEMQNKIKEIIKVPNIRLTQFGYNIHHGRGLDFGINKSTKKYQFLIDSDSYFIKKELFENVNVPENSFGIGRIVITNEKGQNDINGNVKYLHPNCCIIDKEKYSMSKSLINHGAPFIETMINMEFPIIDKWNVISDYVFFGSRGTVNRFGYKKDDYK
jgi:glycosyltransferase involved in cell wall biosynthesis